MGGYTRSALEPVFFEDLPLGAEWMTRGRTITEADVAAFARLAWDFNPLHVDADYARSAHFEGTVAQGSFLAAAAIGLGSMDAPLPATVGLVGMTWRFMSPVRPGDSVRTRWRLARKRAVENPGWGLAVWQVHVLDSAGQEVAAGEVARLVQRRLAPAEEEATGTGRRRRRSGRGTAEPLPAPEPLSIEAEPQAPVAPAASGRRRRGRRAATTAEPVEVEPVAAEAPASNSRRRRRRRGGNGSSAPGEAEAVPEPAPPEPVPAATPRRRRRRRGGNSGAAAAGPEPRPDPAAEPPPPLYGEAAAQALAGSPTGAGISRVLRRLRGG